MTDRREGRELSCSIPRAFRAFPVPPPKVSRGFPPSPAATRRTTISANAGLHRRQSWMPAFPSVTQLDSFCAHSIVEPDPCRSSCPEDPASTSLARATTTTPDGHGPMEGPSSLPLSSTVTSQDFSKVQQSSPILCLSAPTLAQRFLNLGLQHPVASLQAT